MAYFECLHELKLIVDLMYEAGISRHALLHFRHGQVGRRADSKVEIQKPLEKSGGFLI
jgi:ketol-acid reductoisomerase